MKNIDLIRKAVIKHRGGLKKASDSQIMIIWNSLDETTQERYLQKVSKERKGKNVPVSTGTKRDLPGSS